MAYPPTDQQKIEPFDSIYRNLLVTAPSIKKSLSSGIIVKMPETRMNTGLLKFQNDVWQRFDNI
jgi:hypothetical protein